MLEQWITATLASTVVSTALTALGIYLFQNMLMERLKVAVKAEYDAKLETHKAQLAAANGIELEILRTELKREADVAQERLRSQLQIQAAQDSVTFAKLHERRIQAIEATHKKLLALHAKVGMYINAFQPAGGPTDADQLAAAAKAYDEFKQDFVDLQLFLPRNVMDAMKKIDCDLREITNRFTIIVKADPKRPNTDVWIETINRFENGITKAIEALHEDMRVALGDKPATE